MVDQLINDDKDVIKKVIELLSQYKDRQVGYIIEIPKHIVERCIWLLETKILSEEDRYDYLR